MIYEYAVEPELVSTWTDPHDCRFCRDSFGMDKGRLISRYSKRWKKRVWDAFSDSRTGGTNLSEKELAVWQSRESRLTALLQQMDESMIKRSGVLWDSTMSWIDNICREDNRIPFHAILAKNSLESLTNIITYHDLLERSHSLWDIETSKRIPRKTSDMAKAVCLMLCRGQKIHFIDPHFVPGKKRYLTSFQAFFREIIRYRSQPYNIHIEVHLSAGNLGNNFFIDECKQKIPGIVPEGLIVTFRRWRQRQGGEKLHDRFILTDIGGVKFSVGLDEGKKGETTDVSLMQLSEYKQIWSQYAGPEPAFDPEDVPLVISGTMPCDDIKNQ